MSVFAVMRSWLDDFISLFFPRLCVCCGEGLNRAERDVCTDCLCSLPRTRLHETEANLVEMKFLGRVDVCMATSFLFFEKDTVVQKLLHEIKYHDNSMLAERLGLMFGSELRGGRFEAVDVIVPVPLHRKRLKERGYNQSERIAAGIGRSLCKPVAQEVLVRTKGNETQTKKGRVERWENVCGIFSVLNADLVQGKHVLLVDDVLTTGATVEACVEALASAKNTKVSVATIATVQ